MNLSLFSKKHSPLAYKILLTILISSTIITIIIIAIQLRFEYRSDMDTIEKRLDQIEKSYSQSLALSVWNFNKAQYEILLDGILSIEDIAYVSITTPSGKLIIAKGKDKKDKIITKEILLQTTDFGEKVESGKLTIVVSLERVYENLSKRIFIILTTQAIKTLIISIIILFSFYYFITRHLLRLSNYTRDIDLDSDDKFILDREPIEQNDELDFIVFALNDMKVKIKNNYQTIKDINENLEKKIEDRTEELIVERDKAQQATKIKSQFLANMSHEIRTPMNSIIGMSHLALETSLDEKQKEYIQRINNSADSLLNIINDILDFSKIEAKKLEINRSNFEFRYLLENVSNVVKFKADEKGLDFKINYDEKISYLYGDGLRISQILINLINNAIKFTESGYIKVNIIDSGIDSVYRFEVEDSGIGLKEEQISKLFQSFTQADSSTTRKYGGTGLGLSISKELVELMGGKIWVESRYGVGSKFIFEIKLEEYNRVETDRQNIDTNDDMVISTHNKHHTKLLILSKEKKSKLFNQLNEALISKRSKQYKPIIHEIEKYRLDSSEEKLFNYIKNLVKGYKIEEAIKQLHKLQRLK